MKNSTEYPFEIQVGFSTIAIHNLTERIEFAQANPDLAYKVRINRTDCKRQGIDYRLFDPINPLNEFQQRRLLVSLQHDPDFRQAFSKILAAGGGRNG